MTKETTPYFYIIQHKETKIMYAGSRYAKGCHPDEFMQPNGYQTSSVTILNIIEKEGLSIFNILRIDTNCDDVSSLRYETSFLQCLNCAKSPYWYNGHNNDTLMAYGTEEFKLKSIETCFKNFGVKYPMQSEKVREKSKITSIINYGCESHTQSYISKSRLKQSNLKKYGYENTFQVPEFKDKGKISKLKKYGNETFNNREKSNTTCIDKYGVKNIHQVQSVIDKTAKTISERYTKSELNNLTKQGIFNKHGVNNASQIPFFSIIETKKTYAKNVLSRRFPEFKQFYI